MLKNHKELIVASWILMASWTEPLSGLPVMLKLISKHVNCEDSSVQDASSINSSISNADLNDNNFPDVIYDLILKQQQLLLVLKTSPLGKVNN